MANRQRAEARRKAAAKSGRQSGEGGSKLWLWISLGVVVAIVAIGVLFALGGDDGKSVTPGTETTVDSKLPDSQPVTVTGDPLPAFDQTEGDEAIGMTAPILEGSDFQGDPITIDAAADGPTMVVFLAHWCVHCNAEVPVLLDWKNSGGVPPELNVVGVATAVSSQAPNYPPAQWFSEKGWSWPVLVDEKVDDSGSAGKGAQAYGATGWPYFVIIGEDGTVKVRVSGEVPADELQQIVDAALTS